MFLFFPLIIIILSLLLLYFTYKYKTDLKIENLTSDLLKVNEEKTNIEVKYNKIVSELKKQEELKIGKNLDEIQLLFSKVNMIDDKLSFFNTAFKSKLDFIISALENNLPSMDESPKIENTNGKTNEFFETPKVDIREEISDELDEPEETSEKIDKEINKEVEEVEINKEEETTDTYEDAAEEPNYEPSVEENKEANDITEYKEEKEENAPEEEIENNTIEDEEQIKEEAEYVEEEVEEASKNDIEEKIITEEDLNENTNETFSNDLTLQESEEKLFNEDVKEEINMNDFMEESNSDIKIENSIEEDKNEENPVVDQIQPFDNSAVLDIDILSKDFNDENELIDDAKDTDKALNGGNHLIQDDELNSALKDLNSINVELDAENNKHTKAEIKNNDLNLVDDVDQQLLDLSKNLENDLNIDNIEIDGIKNVAKAVNMQNIEEKFENDLKENAEPLMDGSIDNNNFDSIDENTLNSDNLEDETIENNVAFDIKESIEKLKAQLDENKEDKK